MGIIPDELKTQTFPCPGCGQIISSEVDVCRFCALNIDHALRELVIQKELDDRRNLRLRNHKIYAAIGFCVFVFGLIGVALPMLESYTNSRSINFSCMTPILVIGGLMAMAKGVLGYRRETQRI